MIMIVRKHLIELYVGAFLVFDFSIPLLSANKGNGTELSLPYNHSHQPMENQSEFIILKPLSTLGLITRRNKTKFRKYRHKRQLLTIEGSGYDVALQSPNLNDTQMEFEFPDEKRNYTVEIVEISRKTVEQQDDEPMVIRKSKLYLPNNHNRINNFRRNFRGFDFKSPEDSLEDEVQQFEHSESKSKDDDESTESSENSEDKVDSRNIWKRIMTPLLKPIIVMDTENENESEEQGMQYSPQSPPHFKPTTTKPIKKHYSISTTLKPVPKIVPKYSAKSSGKSPYPKKDPKIVDLEDYLAGYSKHGLKAENSDQVNIDVSTESPPSTEFQLGNPKSKSIQFTAEISEDSESSTNSNSEDENKKSLPESPEGGGRTIGLGPTRSQNFYSHAQIVPLTRSSEDIEKEEELIENAKHFAANDPQPIVFASAVRYAPNRGPLPTATENPGTYKYSNNPKNKDGATPTLTELYRQGHPGVLPPPKPTHRSHPLKSPYQEDVDYQSPFKPDPHKDDPPLKFDPESDRFYGEPVPDKKVAQPNRHEPVQIDNTYREYEPPRSASPARYRDYEPTVDDGRDDEAPRSKPRSSSSRRKKYQEPSEGEDYDDESSRSGLGHQDEPIYPPSEPRYPSNNQRNRDRDSDSNGPNGYIKDFVSLDNNFQTLPRVNDDDFGSLLPPISDDNFRPYSDQENRTPRPRYHPTGEGNDRRDERRPPPVDDDYTPDSEERDRDHVGSRGPSPGTTGPDEDYPSYDDGDDDRGETRRPKETRRENDDFVGGYNVASRNLPEFGGGERVKEDLNLDPIYTRTLKQFDDEIRQMQKTEGGRENGDNYPPPEREYRSNPPIPGTIPYRPKPSRLESVGGVYEGRPAPPTRPPLHDTIDEGESPEHREPIRRREEQEEEEEEPTEEKRDEEPEQREEEEEPAEEDKDKEESTIKSKTTTKGSKDNRPPPQKPQPEKFGNLDEDISNIREEYERSG